METHGRRILIIEDEVDFANALRETLEAERYEVLLAADGRDGLAKARRDRPDLILLDLMLPEVDGFTICRLLKFDERYQRIPILMLTARAQESDRALGAQVGADRYLLKSERPETLLKHIRDLLPAA